MREMLDGRSGKPWDSYDHMVAMETVPLWQHPDGLRAIRVLREGSNDEAHRMLREYMARCVELTKATEMMYEIDGSLAPIKMRRSYLRGGLS